MSGAPKRLHEEGAHSATSKRAHEDNIVFSSVSGKLIPPGKNDYHLSSEVGSDGRMTKIPRLESRDDSRLRLDRVFRVPSPANGSCLDHSGASESRLDHRDSKDSRDSKPDTRETKAELRELYTENRMDTPISKGENSVRPETRGNDKDTRSEREFRSDAKNEGKLVRDSAALSFHLSTKDPKEHQKTKRYQESSTDGLDQWHTAHHNIQNTDETGKEIRIQEGRESWEVHETVVDSKSELKGEEKSKENERKKKDEKYKDWGEREKDRNDRHNNLHLGSSGKEFFREDRDSERWERERMESQINKEWKDRDKDSMKKSSLNVNDKETLRNEKNPIDSVLKTSEEEATASEVKKTKEFDNWKAGDRDNKDRKRDRDQDAEVDRHDKRNRAYDKESDDGCVEGDGFGERDREAFSYGIQQRRRMLRQRGSSQATQREPRLRSRSREIEGSQEKPEVSSIVYKVGECMQELLKAWKEFEATHDSKEEAFQNGPTLEIRIPAEHVTATNRQVRGGQMWGTDIYTDDSDIVAVLMHTGYCRPTASSPPPAVHELRATIRVLPPQDCYTSTLRNNVRSRAWGAGISCSYRVEKCCIVKKGGGTIDLEPRLNHISAVEPTLAPVSVERTMTTRAAASNALRQQRFLREVTVQYNLCNEPWLKYSINVVADKGLKKPLYTSARLKKGEVLYLETHFNRYELCFNGERSVSNSTAASVYSAHESGQEKPQHHSTQFVTGDRNVDNIVDLFRWSRCKKPLPQKTMRSIGIPLPVEHLEVLEENLDWEDVQWSQTGVWIAAKEYVLARVHFLSSS